MRVLFHLGHPAHFHLFKFLIKKLMAEGVEVDILIKKKDILEDLLRNADLPYKNILPEGRKSSKLGIALGLMKQSWRMFRYVLFNRPRVLLGTSGNIGIVGTMLGIPNLNFNEDDAAAIPLYAKVSYPFATKVLSPVSCNNGKWADKTVHYPSYHELAYLHPNHFTADRSVAGKYVDLSRPYFIIRFAQLTAHHDEGVEGLSDKRIQRFVEFLKPKGTIYITSERAMSEDLAQYRLRINPLDIHHVMAFASLFVGDSQTMAAESAVLGVPFVRVNNFVGKLGYLDELELKYGLGFGAVSASDEGLWKAIYALFDNENREKDWQEKRNVMLSERVDYSEYQYEYIQKYIKKREA